MDRNYLWQCGSTGAAGSLSARRAWIEIPDARPRICGTFVALRKESVDRNLKAYRKRRYAIRSLSARRAWIEIIMVSDVMNTGVVALRKESVDRNDLPLQVRGPDIPSLSARRAWIEMLGSAYPGSMQSCRSPQGERG